MMPRTFSLSGGAWSARVCPALGANVVSLRYEGRDVFVPLTDRAMLDVNPYLQGAPLLLPANRTAKGKFSFEGRDYALAITEEKTGANLHGLLHRQSFSVTASASDHLTLFYRNCGEIYPFPFEITVRYGVEGDAFLSAYEVKNTGEGNMPLTFALHTTFVEPSSFSVPVDACHAKDENHIPYGPYEPLSGQEASFPTGSGSKGLEISGYYRAFGSVARIGDFLYEVSENFDHWILYNGRGESGLLCVEPQCGKANGLNTADGHLTLRAGESAVFSTRLTHI